MAVIEGYSHKEIAKILGIEPHSSSSQLARAKAMLRKIINKRMLAIVSFFLISIPLYRILWRKPKIEMGTHIRHRLNTGRRAGSSILPRNKWRKCRHGEKNRKRSSQYGPPEYPPNEIQLYAGQRHDSDS